MKSITEFTKLRITILAAHIGAAVGLCLLWDPAWLLLSAVCTFAFLWISQEMYVHRYLCHRSFSMPVLAQRVCAALSVYNLYGNPIGVASTHTTHHKYSDTDKDPHPASTPWRSWFWLTDNFDKSIDPSTARRLMKDPWLKFIANNYFKIYFLTILIAGLISLKILLYAFLVTHVYAFAANGLITVFCHGKGHRRYKTSDTSTNNSYVNALLLFNGVAMHNNHHAKPTRSSNSEAWYEVDVIGLIVRLFFVKSSKAI